MYQIWSRYGYEDETLIGEEADLRVATNRADIEGNGGIEDVRVWEQLPDGEMRDLYTAVTVQYDYDPHEGHFAQRISDFY